MKRPRSFGEEDYFFGPYLGHGSVHDLGDSSPPDETAAILVVPDPEQRRGWREYYVYRDKPNAKPEPMGFKPNGRRS